MRLYLKGFHLSLEMWRGDRDEEGWKLKHGSSPPPDPNVEDKQGEVMDDKGFVKGGPASGLTPVVPRFRKGLEVLMLLTARATPVKRIIRQREIVTAIYGFGDASLGGFGASVGLPQGIHSRFGVWGRDEEDKSSNYRELRNLVDTVEEEAQVGRLARTEL